MSTLPQNALFGRSSSLIVSKNTQGIELGNLKFTFSVSAADNETPNIAIIRVYNLSDKTAKQIINEFDVVTLQAGYQNSISIIFQGTIKQFRRGRERNIDSYLDILAADGDVGYNFGFVNQTLAAGSRPQDQLSASAAAMGLPVDPNASGGLTGGVLPRGKVLFGLARLYMRDLASTNNVRWSIQKGVLTVIPVTGYLPGQAVKINSATGMIGIPEATDNGIVAKVLLNPLIKIGQQVQINEKDVTQTIVKQQFFPSYSSGPTLVANVTLDGFYRVLVVEHQGDTRGQEWYTNLVCLSLDPSAKPASAVKAFG